MLLRNRPFIHCFLRFYPLSRATVGRGHESPLMGVEGIKTS